MAEIRRPTSVLDSLGEEVIRIVAPVSICMFMVVILVTLLTGDSASSLNSIATIAYTETTSDSSWDKFKGALLNSLAFVAVVTLVTFLLVLLFYFRCTQFLKLYMGFSAFVILGFMGGEVALFLIQEFSVPIDCVTFLVVLLNIAVVGVLAVFMSKMAILVTQGYLVLIGVLVAYWFTLLPEWTTWMLLVAMALYDLAAVLLPVGPLKLLVELAISRDEDIPALVYEARPVVQSDLDLRGSVVHSRVWRERRNAGNDSTANPVHGTPYGSNLDPSNLEVDPGAVGVIRQNETRVMSAETGYVSERVSELSAPLIDRRMNAAVVSLDENLMLEGIGLGSSGAIKLGLGDFIFYSVLVGRAAMYDYMTVYACYLAIIAGLGLTLMLLAVYQKALPALPFSVLLGVLFYFLTRLLLEEFVVQCSLNLVMF